MEITGYIKNGYFYHTCGRKIFKVLPESVLINFSAFCPKCKKEFVISIVNDELIQSRIH